MATYTQMEKERKAKNAVALEGFKALYQQFETLELPTLKGFDNQIVKAEAARAKYIAEKKADFQRLMKNAIKNGLGYDGMGDLRRCIELLKTRPTASYWLR